MSDEALAIAAEIIKERLAQQEQQTMFVYFDDRGTIKCISPIEDVSLGETLQKTQLPLSKVKRFIDGEANMNLFYVKKKLGKITEFDIIEKVSNINYIKKLDRSLTKINMKKTSDWELKITWFKNKQTVTFALSNTILSEFTDQIQDYSNADINGFRILSFHLTAPDRPDILAETLSVPVSELLSQPVEIKTDYDVSELSLYTNQIFKMYSYEEIV